MIICINYKEREREIMNIEKFPSEIKYLESVLVVDTCEYQVNHWVLEMIASLDSDREMLAMQLHRMESSLIWKKQNMMYIS